MHVTVEQKGCIRCGFCACACPNVFSITPGESALAITDEVPKDCEIAVRTAIDRCPSLAIRVGP